MNQTTDSLLFNHTDRLPTSMHLIMRRIHGLKKLTALFSPLPVSELLMQLEEASSPASLTSIVNKIQTVSWKQSSVEQSLIRQHMLTLLTRHVLHGKDVALRLEAAGWMRLLVQAGLVAQPQEVFVTLVTAAVNASKSEQNEPGAENAKELPTLLTLIFQCFWPFRHPYPAYKWELFPDNEVFYPLASLINHVGYEAQDTLVGIFSELPTLEDVELSRHLLPVSLQWARDTDPERRRRIANVLARINQTSTHEALSHLLSDADPAVRESAKSATVYMRRA